MDPCNATRRQKMSRVEREAQAEATAYVVLRALGLPSTAPTYIAWQGGDGAAVLRSLGPVQRAVRTILDAGIGASRVSTAFGYSRSSPVSRDLSMRTSANDPIHVGMLDAADRGLPGRIGLAIAPSKKDPARLWDRDLEADLARLGDELGVELLVHLLEPHEDTMLRTHRAPNLPFLVLSPACLGKNPRGVL